MSELADIIEAIQSVSHQGKIRGLSGLSNNMLTLAVGRAKEGNAADIEEQAPKALRAMGDYWHDRTTEAQIEDLKLEIQAHQIALNNSAEDIAKTIESKQQDADDLSRQHEAGLKRMGNGNRPTASAVAGEGAAGTFSALRVWHRAAEI